MRGDPANLLDLYNRTLDWERAEGIAYYDNQRARLQARCDAGPIAAAIGLRRVIAAFAALSPNNSEAMNYRALDTCIDIVSGYLPEDAKVVAFGRSRTKALAILRGEPVEEILSGQKVTAFFHNTLDPDNDQWVTVDGHMLNAWIGEALTLIFRSYDKEGRVSTYMSGLQGCLTPAWNPHTEVSEYIMAGLETNQPNIVQSTVTIRVGGKLARIPSWLPAKGWSINDKGYLIYTSRKKGSIKRGTRAHRLALERLAGAPLPNGIVVHHMDFNKLNCCPCNLLQTTEVFNPSMAFRDPYTGEFLSAEEWRRRYGVKRDEPDWVTS